MAKPTIRAANDSENPEICSETASIHSVSEGDLSNDWAQAKLSGLSQQQERSLSGSIKEVRAAPDNGKAKYRLFRDMRVLLTLKTSNKRTNETSQADLKSKTPSTPRDGAARPARLYTAGTNQSAPCLTKQHGISPISLSNGKESRSSPIQPHSALGNGFRYKDSTPAQTPSVSPRPLAVQGPNRPRRSDDEEYWTKLSTRQTTQSANMLNTPPKSVADEYIGCVDAHPLGLRAKGHVPVDVFADVPPCPPLPPGLRPARARVATPPSGQDGIAQAQSPGLTGPSPTTCRCPQSSCSPTRIEGIANNLAEIENEIEKHLTALEWQLREIQMTAREMERWQSHLRGVRELTAKAESLHRELHVVAEEQTKYAVKSEEEQVKSPWDALGRAERF